MLDPALLEVTAPAHRGVQRIADTQYPLGAVRLRCYGIFMPHLLIQNGASHPQKHELNGDRVTIGRSPGNSIVLAHDSVSSRHAEIRCSGDQYRIHDLGSANGTKLNGDPVKEAVLNDGDVITFGPVDARFESEPANPLPENGTGAGVKQKVKDPTSISSSLRHTAAKVISNIGVAARQAALRAKIEKVKRFKLRAARHALGKKCFELSLAPEVGASERRAIKELRRKLEKKTGDSIAAPNQRIKRLASETMAVAEEKAARIRLYNLYVALGELLSRCSNSSELPDAERTTVEKIEAELASMEERLVQSGLEEGRPWRLIFRSVIIALAGVTVVGVGWHFAERKWFPRPEVAMVNLPQSEPPPGDHQAGISWDEQNKLQIQEMMELSAEPLKVPSWADKMNPSYRETIRFINAKTEDGLRQEIGVGQKSGALIIRRFYENNLPKEVIKVDGAVLSPQVKVFTLSERRGLITKEKGVVAVGCSNGEKRITAYGGVLGFAKGQVSSFQLRCDDALDAEKVAKALSHLISAAGGRADRF